MLTYGDIVEDVLVTLGYTHDDAVRNVPNGMFGLAMVLDTLKRERLEKELNSGYGSRGTSKFMTTFTQVPVLREAALKDRAYFTLPGPLQDLRVNGGVEYIAYNAASNCRDNLVGRRFTLSSPAELDMLQHSPVQKPSEYEPYYFLGRFSNAGSVISDRVWLMGISPIIKSVEVGLYLSSGAWDDIDPDEPADIPSDMVLLVKRHMLDLERWVLLTPQQRLTNEGRDMKQGQQPLQPPQAISVNDQSLRNVRADG